jgi:hypothetical protein
MMGTLKRLLFVASAIWLAVWAFVGWRGYEQSSDAHRYIDMLPPGAKVPEAALTALAAGQSWIREAVIFGAALPLCLLLMAWIIRPAVKERFRPRS